MGHDINLSGGDITMIKNIGLSGSAISGQILIERCAGMGDAEIIESLKDLIALGYVVADNETFHSSSDIAKVQFRVNTSYARDLKEALDPQPKKVERRQRRT
ncbi:MAG: hypothetical protein ABIT76_13355 [Chthoniobacterales bacterium]